MAKAQKSGKLRKGEKVLRPLRPNAGFEAEYRRRLTALVDEMTSSVDRTMLAGYKRNEPAMAQDDAPSLIEARYEGGSRPWTAYVDGEPLRTTRGAILRFGSQETARAAARRYLGEILPADELQKLMADVGAYWIGRFDEASQKLAQFFSKGNARRTDDQLRAILRDGGISVRFQPTAEHLDVLRASVHENVALIKSIPQQYLKNVEGMVMRSVQRGRDLEGLTNDLQKQTGVTRRRAAFIARDQNNKATSVFQETRRKELGIKEAIWLHSHGGKTPRPKHLAAHGMRYDVEKGLPVGDDGGYVHPGEEINCRCVSRSIIPGL